MQIYLKVAMHIDKPHGSYDNWQRFEIGVYGESALDKETMHNLVDGGFADWYTVDDTEKRKTDDTPHLSPSDEAFMYRIEHMGAFEWKSEEDRRRYFAMMTLRKKPDRPLPEKGRAIK